MKNIKSLKGMWVVVFPSGAVAYWSFAYTKRQSIKLYTQDADWIKNKEAYWEERISDGLKCIKVNINFEEYKND